MNDLIIVDENDIVLGFASKFYCHLNTNIDDGFIHRAFSILIFNENNEFLITERSLEKITFPGYVTNACCSHQLKCDYQDQNFTDIQCSKKRAIQRLNYELGIKNVELDELIFVTKILYKCRFDNVYGEFEMDYIFVLKKSLILKPNPNEVKSYNYFNKNNLKTFLGLYQLDYL